MTTSKIGQSLKNIPPPPPLPLKSYLIFFWMTSHRDCHFTLTGNDNRHLNRK